MKLQDAPPAGWYPDPERRTSLRWWEGTDWTDDRRALPTVGEAQQVSAAGDQTAVPPLPRPTGSNRAGREGFDADQLVSRVRDVAREEVDRAADLFSKQARSAIARGRSIVGEYASDALRLIRRVVAVAAVLVVLWFVLQFIAQAAFFDWLGDRLDSLTGD